MFRLFSVVTFSMAFGMLVGSCTNPVFASEKTLAPFSTDGCSVFIDGPVGPNRGASWSHCCVAHDLIYWRGGNSQQRRWADNSLKLCVNKATKDSNSNPLSLGQIMWQGVRVGGAPRDIFNQPNLYPWRWGYGTIYTDYRELTRADYLEILGRLGELQANFIPTMSGLDLSEEQKSFVKLKIQEQVEYFQYKLQNAL